MGMEPGRVRRRSSGYRDQDLDLYPSGDDEPSCESPWHGDSMQNFRDLLIGLRELRGKEKEWYVGRDNFWYYREGDGTARLTPDVMFIPNVEDAHEDRDSWLDWLENGQRPTVIYEVLAPRCWRDNLHGKKDTCETLGVVEYFLFDPRGDFVEERFQGFRLVDGSYERIAPDAHGRLESRELDAWIWPNERLLHLIDRVSGREIRTLAHADAEAKRLRWLEKSEAERAQIERSNAIWELRQASGMAELHKTGDPLILEYEEARVAKLRAALRAMGIDPDNLP